MTDTGSKVVTFLFATVLILVGVLGAIDSAVSSTKSIDMEVTDSKIGEFEGEYVAAVEVTGVQNTTVSVWPTGNREPTEHSAWIALGKYDTHEEAQQAIDEYDPDRSDLLGEQ